MSHLEASGLSVAPVIHAVDLQLHPGQTLALVGANGAGKSTLLAALAGALRPSAGQLRRAAPCVYLPEAAPLDRGVKARDWLRLAARLPGWEPAFAEALLAALPLPRDRPPEALSLGERTRLGLVLSLGRAAPLYLLDDPFLGLDPVARAEAQRAISQRATPDSAVLMATADLSSVARLATHLALIRGGRLLGLEALEDWPRRVRAMAVRGGGDPATILGSRLLHRREERGEAALLVEDPGGQAEAALRAAGGAVTPLPLSLEELVERRLTA